MTDERGRDGPVLIELDSPGPSPVDAPPVAEPLDAPTGQAMQTMATLAARQPSVLSRWFWRLLLSVIVFVVSLAAWDWITGLIARNTILGWVAVGLIGMFVAVCLAIILRELAALSRLTRIEALHADAARVREAEDLEGARGLVKRLRVLYAGREELRWGADKLKKAEAESFDADTLLTVAEETLLVPLDALAERQVEAAARQVATVTALIPLAFADVIAALTANLRMIRQISEIYGGRSGRLGSWRLIRAVMTHLVATGAVAVGEDLFGSIGGGHLLSRVSRRFGEGLVNGALTARVGVAAMEVCRPLPFTEAKRPGVTGIVRRALTGLFNRNGDT